MIPPQCERSAHIAAEEIRNLTPADKIGYRKSVQFQADHGNENEKASAYGLLGALTAHEEGRNPERFLLDLFEAIAASGELRGR